MKGVLVGRPRKPIEKEHAMLLLHDSDMWLKMVENDQQYLPHMAFSVGFVADCIPF